jgi:hypothetical protein
MPIRVYSERVSENRVAEALEEYSNLEKVLDYKLIPLDDDYYFLVLRYHESLKNDTKNSPEKRKKEKEMLEEIMEVWNSYAKDSKVPNIIKMNDKRETGTLNRIEEYDFDKAKEAIKIFFESDFLTGKKTHFFGSYDFLFCSPKNFLKTIEGNYANVEPKGEDDDVEVDWLDKYKRDLEE